MPLPRFTSGRIGRLSYDVVNQAFDKIEGPQNGGNRREFSDSISDVFAVLITGVHPTNPSRYSFVEIQYDGFALSPTSIVSGGRTSSNGTDTFAYPAIGAGAAEGDKVLVASVFTLDGTNAFRIIREAQSITFPAIISASSVIVADVRWRYTMSRVNGTVTGTAYPSWTTVGASFTGYNGAENVTDASGIYGVGMQPPQTGSATFSMKRQPIKNGVVVPVTIDANGTAMFSIPNGYKVTC